MQRDTHVRTAIITAVVCLLSACKQQQGETPAPKSSQPADKASSVPASVPPDNAVPNSVADTTDARVISVRAQIAQFPTEYSARFVADQLRSITEARTTEGRHANGRYEFYGARLTRYAGESLNAALPVQLDLDLQGGVVANVGELSATEIEALKNRAQLLRSHALARQAARNH